MIDAYLRSGGDASWQRLCRTLEETPAHLADAVVRGAVRTFRGLCAWRSEWTNAA